MVKILVSGLTLCENRGGPAMAISFINNLNRYLKAQYVFSVPADRMDLEREWAKKYHVDVVPSTSLVTYYALKLPHNILKLLMLFSTGKFVKNDEFKDKISLLERNFLEHVNAIKESDCLVNLNGIAFVGDGTRPLMAALNDCSPSLYAKKFNKPFFRFVQSYGPFDNLFVKILAKREFKKLPCVMARGDISAKNCKDICKNVPVFSFPDIATNLKPADEGWYRNFLEQIQFNHDNYTILSPSAVIASMDTKSEMSVGKNHLAVFVNLTKYFLSRDKKILFLPHTTSLNPTECDRHVCKKILEVLVKENVDVTNCKIVEQELDCQELKALFYRAEFCILSRYHALVAALSMGIPAVSLGWNDKYEDLLAFYHVSEFSVDSRKGNPSEITEQIIEKHKLWTKEKVELIKKRQPELESSIDESVKICSDWIRQVITKDSKV
jgi:polysaccharide pyruvyl transferase WcaK-like protein